MGGHEIRFDPKIDAGVAINMYPELGDRLYEQSARPPLYMLSTHGYRRFIAEQDNPTVAARLGPVTGMTGSRERDERLFVAYGRNLRCFRDPENSATQTAINFNGHHGQRLRPVLGACRIGSNFYWVKDNGEIWKQSGSTVEEAERVADLGVRAIGLACYSTQGGTDADFLFFTCVEDRMVRCLRNTNTGWVLDPERYLDLSDTAVVSPESLWMDLPGEGTARRMLIVDAVAARIIEAEFETANDPATDEPWSISTPFGIRNPLNVQRLLGDPETEEPVVLGGIVASDTEIRVIVQPNTIAVIGRRTGRLNVTYTIGDLKDGETLQKVLCGGVGGQSRSAVVRQRYAVRRPARQILHGLGEGQHRT